MEPRRPDLSRRSLVTPPARVGRPQRPDDPPAIRWTPGPGCRRRVFPDGRTIASASYDRTVKLWRPETRAAARHPRGHTDEVRAVAFSPDGQRIASAGLDRSLRVWNAQSGAPLAVIWGTPARCCRWPWARQQKGRDGLRRRDGTRLGHHLGPGALHLQGAHRRGRRRRLQPRW